MTAGYGRGVVHDTGPKNPLSVPARDHGHADKQLSTAPNCCTAVFVALLTGSLSQIHTMVLFNLAHRIYVCVGGINVNVNVTDLSMC